MNNHQILKAFIQFLKENNCYKEFRENINSLHSTKDFKKWFNLFLGSSLHSAHFKTSGATFTWSTTEQGQNFWVKIFDSQSFTNFENNYLK